MAKPPESGNYPAFYVDPQERIDLPGLEESETKTVADRFNQIFDDFMLQNMADVQQQEPIIQSELLGNVLDEQQVSISGLLKTKDNTYRLCLVDSMMLKRSTRKISLQRIDQQGYGREYWRYDLSELSVDAGTVTRCDGGDMRESVPRYLPPEAGDQTSDSESIQRQLDHIKNELRNEKLEKDMGLNNQPVSLAEINGLADFIDQNRQSFVADNPV